MLARLRVEQLLRLQLMAPRRPCVRRPTRNDSAAEVLGRHAAVLQRLLELAGGILVQASRRLQCIAHGRSSSGAGTAASAEKRAYATLGSDVSSGTAAPCRSAVSFAG